MPAKILFALLLILHNAAMVGAVTAAGMPDEQHPWGQDFQHDYLHHHAHDHDHDHDEAPAADAGAAQHIGLTQTAHDAHDVHHEHSSHSQMNMAMSATLGLDLPHLAAQASTRYAVQHQSQTYTPPVPPPNR